MHTVVHTIKYILYVYINIHIWICTAYLCHTQTCVHICTYVYNILLKTIQSKTKKTKKISFSSILAKIVPHSFQWENLTALITEMPLKNGYFVQPLRNGVDEFIPCMKTKGVEVQPIPALNVRKFIASWHPMTSSHRIAAAPTSMAGAASGECSEKKKLRPCHMEETALPAAESRFKGGRHGVSNLATKGGPPTPKKKALTVYCIHVVLLGAPKKMARKYGFHWFFSNPENKWS